VMVADNPGEMYGGGVEASTVGGTALARLGRMLNGSVHSVYRGAVNLRTDQGLVSLVPGREGRGPLNVTIESDRWPMTGTRPGDEVRVMGRNILVGRRLTVSLSGAEVYEPVRKFNGPVLPASVIGSNLSKVRESVIVRGRFEGVAGLLFALEPNGPGSYTLNPTCRLALPGVVGVLDGIRHESAKEVREAAKSLVGLGVGLTPSSDDMLCGLMSSFVLGRLNCVGREDGSGLFTEVAVEAEGRTPILSMEYIREAAEGRTNEKVAKFIEAVYTRTGPELSASAVDVLNVGASSGTDIAVGVVLGVRSVIGGGRA
jgi:hypothetical protein